MSVTASPLTLATIVPALRAAGCVFAEDEAELILATAAGPAAIAAMVERRVAGLPLEHVLGWAEFGGLRIAVGPGVFVPRRRTEFLVRQAAALAGPGAVVVDLCCGSGALGAALAATLGRAELHAADVEPAAVRCARRNIGDAGEVYEGDLFEPLPASLRGRVEILLANVPYVPTDDVELLPRRPGSTNRGWRWTVARTASTSCAGSPPRPRGGWRRAGICWSRRANGRRHGPRRPSPAAA